ncbi:MAG TPA: arabinofuranosidase catalytic domain-containing protein [Polyangiaceae bacterium]|nr:arabinofuranosidase catalytic domain-containing protein [Polyangiaceae bacterium]
MRNGQVGLFSVFVLAAFGAAAGCSSGSNTGGAAGAPAMGGGSNGGSSSSGGGAGAGPSCGALSPCGGSVVGAWKVTSSCLKLSGDMDVTLASLGCPKVPVVGSLTTTGTFTANADGTFTDNTKTTGSATFPLSPACLSISSVQRSCEQISSIFQALGWATSSCVSTNGQCNCTVTADQTGGLGTLSEVETSKGQYSTSGNLLTTDDTITPYCVSGDQLTIAPQFPALSGTVVFSKDMAAGAGGSGAGGAPGAGGSGATGGTGTAGMAQGGSSSGGAPGAGGSGGQATVDALPCDIYAAANTACVAAHSTVRALLRTYAGNLYQVKRASDGMTKDIPVLSAGGFADSATQDTFCMGTTCTILKVYDQSGHGNAVEAEIPGLVLGNGANAHEGHSGMSAANAAKESLMVGGHKVYALYTNTSQAYWRDGSATGMPLGASPQSVYVVTSGKHFNTGCCYDYGNGEVSRTYVPGNSMDALYFGSGTQWGSGNGAGPWVMADLEGGVFSGLTTGKNDMLISQPFNYVTAMEKNNGTSELALKAADATAQTLNTYYKGKLPNGKSPGQKQGSIVLGSGGDCCYSNNNASAGTFYEGAIVAGYPSDATDAAVHANIVNTGYGK